MPDLKVHDVITIGNKYADQLGYSDLVGSTGVVTQVLKATSEVLIVSSKNKDNLFRQFTIHNDDCIVDEMEGKQYYVVIDITTGRIYYSKDKEMMEYLWKVEFNDKKYLMTEKPVDITEIVDNCNKLSFLKQYKDTFGYDYVLYSLDDPLDWFSTFLRKMYDQHKSQQNNELNILAAQLAIKQFQQQMKELGFDNIEVRYEEE